MSVQLNWPVLLAEMEPSQRHLTLALGVSLFLHAILLSIHFKLPEALDRVRERALDVILVNSKSPHRPQDAQAKAQANMDGGGNSDDALRASTPLPPTLQSKPGDALFAAQQRIAELEARQREILASHGMARLENKPVVPLESEQQRLRGSELPSMALELARMEAEIALSLQEYNQRPRRRFVGTRAAEYRFAQYIERWRQQVERIGNLNYPEAARGRFYGQLLLSVAIRRDGSVERIDINRSSGHKILDQAAVRIVRLGAPYAPFPEAIARDTDVLEITRSWLFVRDQLRTE